jgi:predicted HTH transcriptional regulator
MDFVDLLMRSEGKTMEFKRDLSFPDGVSRSIVALANTVGGTLLAKLLEHALVMEVGTSPQDPKRRYFRTR